MRMYFYFLALLLAAFPSFAAPLSLPQSAEGLDPFIPEGWFVLARADGYLDKDAHDVVLILAPDWEKKSDFPPEGESRLRQLVVLFKKQDGSYHLSAIQEGIVLGKNDGGMMGDPFDAENGLKIDKGVIVLNFYGGSRDRWGMTYRFRFQNQDWFLIGFTDMVADNIELTSTTTDVNWSTGKMIITKTKEEKNIETKTMTKTLSPVRLKEFTLDKVRKQLY